MINRNSPELVELTSKLLLSRDLVEIVKAAAAVVQNPVAVIDSSYAMLAWSHLETVQDKTWLERVKEGYWDYDFVAKVKHSTENATQTPKQSAIVTGLSPLRRRIDSLTLRGGWLGYSAVLEMETPLEDIDEDVYAYVRDVLAKALAAERAYYIHSGQDTGTSFMLRDLLNMHFPNKILFQERIRGSVFDRNTIFQLFSISLDEYVPSGEKLKTTLQTVFPHSWSSYDKDNIIVLIDRTATLRDDEQALSRFSNFLQKHSLSAGQSTPFNDLYILPQQREQAARALAIARETPSRFREASVIIPYESCKILDMLSRIPRDERMHYCHSDILCMAQAEALNRTDYMRTVFEYLHTGKSIHTAAGNLHVHHNTVYYRINKAKELFDLDFSDEYRNVHYYISCLIMIYSG